MSTFTRDQLDAMYMPDHDDQRSCEASDIKCEVDDATMKELVNHFFATGRKIPVIRVIDQFGDGRGGAYAYNPKSNTFDCFEHDPDEEDAGGDEEAYDEAHDEAYYEAKEKEDEAKYKEEEGRKRQKLFCDFGDREFDDEEYPADSLAGDSEFVIEQVYWIWLHYRKCGHSMFGLNN